MRPRFRPNFRAVSLLARRALRAEAPALSLKVRKPLRLWGYFTPVSKAGAYRGIGFSHAITDSLLLSFVLWSLGFARDFGSGLRRPLNASSSIARVICISSRLVAIDARHCSVARLGGICCCEFWSGCDGGIGLEGGVCAEFGYIGESRSRKIFSDENGNT